MAFAALVACCVAVVVALFASLSLPAAAPVPERGAGLANVTPTLVAIDTFLRGADADAFLRQPDAALLPPYYLGAFWNPRSGVHPARFASAEAMAKSRLAFARMKQIVARLHAAGVPLHAGTDAPAIGVVPGASLHRELHLLVAAGLTPEEALATSTRNGPAFLAIPGLGEIRPGAPADLAIFRRDPTRDLAALDSLEAVVRGGRFYTREALDAQLAVYQASHRSWLRERFAAPVMSASLRALLWLAPRG